MGLFDMGQDKKEEEKEIRAEQRGIKAQKELSIHNAGLEDDQTYIYDQQQKTDLLKWQQDLDDELVRLRYRLSGYTKIGNEWAHTGAALCNDTFISDIQPVVEPYLSRNLINTTLKEEHIYSMLRNTMHTVVDLMADGHDIYGIDFIKFDAVSRIVLETIRPAPFRALNGFTKIRDSTMAKRIEAYSEKGDERDHRGIFGLRT